MKKLLRRIFGIKICTCPKVCDCQNPPPITGSRAGEVYHLSNYCPIHNDNPYPDENCPIHG